MPLHLRETDLDRAGPLSRAQSLPGAAIQDAYLCNPPARALLPFCAVLLAVFLSCSAFCWLSGGPSCPYTFFIPFPAALPCRFHQDAYPLKYLPWLSPLHAQSP